MALLKRYSFQGGVIDFRQDGSGTLRHLIFDQAIRIGNGAGVGSISGASESIIIGLQAASGQCAFELLVLLLGIGLAYTPVANKTYTHWYCAGSFSFGGSPGGGDFDTKDTIGIGRGATSHTEGVGAIKRPVWSETHSCWYVRRFWSSWF